MYNSELWTTNEMSIDGFQRKLITTDSYMKKTNAESWRKKITRCRLKCLGKLASQPENISARKALSMRMRPGYLSKNRYGDVPLEIGNGAFWDI